MRYFRVLSDLNVTRRWFLGCVKSNNEDISDDIREGKEFPKQNLQVDIQNEGNSLDFTFAAFDVPIISNRIVDIFNFDDIELTPVKVQNQSNIDYFILRTKKYLDAIDKENSEYTLWDESNSFRKDLIGEFRSFSRIKISSDVSENDKIFRIKNYSVVLVVNEKIFKKCVDRKVSGIFFEEV